MAFLFKRDGLITNPFEPRRIHIRRNALKLVNGRSGHFLDRAHAPLLQIRYFLPPDTIQRGKIVADFGLAPTFAKPRRLFASGCQKMHGLFSGHDRLDLGKREMKLGLKRFDQIRKNNRIRRDNIPLLWFYPLDDPKEFGVKTSLKFVIIADETRSLDVSGHIIIISKRGLSLDFFQHIRMSDPMFVNQNSVINRLPTFTHKRERFKKRFLHIFRRNFCQIRARGERLSFNLRNQSVIKQFKKKRIVWLRRFVRVKIHPCRAFEKLKKCFFRDESRHRRYYNTNNIPPFDKKYRHAYLLSQSINQKGGRRC